jgi:UDP-N-acetylglucosamine 2-epimerase
MLNGKNSWSNPFGDGKAGKRIIQILREKFE